jgi:LysM repeat protein
MKVDYYQLTSKCFNHTIFNMQLNSFLNKSMQTSLLIGLIISSAFGQESEAPTDATYVVKKGDTLWDISFSLWGDSFQWPKLWQANPSISNPDLIYPGNVLTIPDRSTPAESPLTTTISSNSSESSFNTETSVLAATNDSLKTMYNDSFSDSALISNLYKNYKIDKSFFAKVPFLWFDMDPQGNIYPGKGIVQKPPSATYQRFDKMIIEPQVENYFKPGDTLDIYKQLKFYEYEGKTANLVQRAGRCVVLESAPKKITASLVEQWDAVIGNERVDKSVKYFPITADTLTTPSIAITGSIFTRAEQTPGLYPFQTVIIDKGEKDGVQKGDIFGLYSTKAKVSTWKLSAVGLTLYVNNSTSSLVLITLVQNALNEGDKAVLVRKAHFIDKEM